MGKYVALALGIVMTIAGALVAFRSFGWIEGGAMEGEQFWGTTGSVLAGLGVALVIVAVKPQPK